MRPVVPSMFNNILGDPSHVHCKSEPITVPESLFVDFFNGRISLLGIIG